MPAKSRSTARVSAEGWWRSFYRPKEHDQTFSNPFTNNKFTTSLSVSFKKDIQQLLPLAETGSMKNHLVIRLLKDHP
jgi:hypothetical protein